MHRQPKCVCCGVGDAVADVGGDEEVITCLQREGWLIGDLQYGCPFHQQHPFILRLIIPKALGAGLTMGVDALDFDPDFLKERGEDFFTSGGGVSQK